MIIIRKNHIAKLVIIIIKSLSVYSCAHAGEYILPLCCFANSLHSEKSQHAAYWEQAVLTVVLVSTKVL